MRPSESNDRPGDGDPSPSLASRLVNYDEAKDAIPDALDSTTDSSPVDAGEEIACIDLLHRVWPALRPTAEGSPLSDVQLSDFRLIREIGRGGMGVVYEAHQLSLRRCVALKILPLAPALSKQRLTRFNNEALAAATLNHPNIVPVYSVGCEQGVHFYAMRLIHGQSLADFITARKLAEEAPAAGNSSTANDDDSTTRLIDDQPSERRSHYADVARFGMQVAEALQYSHGHGIVHRDVKPANLLLDEWGQVWVTDFGLARLGEEAGLTATGDLLGTLRYMSPERVLANHSVADPSSDVYSLGATLYELIALQPAHTGDEHGSLVHRIVEEEPRRLRQLCRHVPVDLETIVGKAIEKDPARRYASAGDLAADLRRFIDHQPIAARPASLVDRAMKWARRHRTLVRGAIVACLLLAGTWMFNSLRIRQALEETSNLLYIADMGLAFQAWENGWTDEVQTILKRQRPRPGEVDRRGIEWLLLNQASQQSRGAALTGHEGPVNEICVFPDRRRLASVGNDGTLRLWDVREKKLLKTIQIGEKALYSVAISSDGRYVAVGSTSVYLWEVDAEAPPTNIFVHDVNIESLAFNEAGDKIVAGCRYHEVCLLSIRGETLGRTPTESRMHTLCFIPGTDQILVPNRRDVGGHKPSGVIQIWNEDLTENLREFQEHPVDTRSSITHAILSPCGKFLAAGELYQSVVHLMSLESGTVTATTPVSRDKLTDIAFMPDRSELVVGYENGVIERHAISTDADGDISLPNRPRAIRAHTGEVLAVRYVDSNTLASCGVDGSIRLWKLSGDHVAELDLTAETINDAEISPDGNSTLLVSDREFVIADLDAGEVKHRQTQTERTYVGGAWAPDGKAYAIGRRSGGIQIYGDDHKLQTEILLPSEPVDFSFSPDGNHLLTLCDQSLSVWQLPTGEQIAEQVLEGHGNVALFSPNGDYVLCGGRFNNILKVYLSENQQSNVEKIECGATVGSLALSPDESLLATGHLDGTIRIWSLGGDGPPRELVGNERQVYKVEFSSDGKTLFSAAADGSIRLWSVDKGRAYGSLISGYKPGMKPTHCTFALSPNRRRLITSQATANPSYPDVMVWDW